MKEKKIYPVARNIRRTGDLTNVPNKVVGDIVFAFRDEETNKLVTYELFGKISEDRIRKLAFRNVFESLTLEPIENILERMGFILNEAQPQMHLEEGIQKISFERSMIWVLSNANATEGAGALLFEKEILAPIGERVGDYYIIPSSIHEVLLVPTSLGGEVSNIIPEINATQVLPQDRLSDTLYYWDSGKKVLTTAAQAEIKKKVEEKA